MSNVIDGNVADIGLIKGTVSGMGHLKGGINTLLARDGDSAYTVAVKNGFEGTEEEWIASLKGETGNGIAYAVLDSDYRLNLIFTDGTTYTTAQSIRGATGARGAKGNKGDSGDDGIGIKSAVLNEDYTLTLTFTDDTTYTTPVIRGEKGESGDSVTVDRVEEGFLDGEYNVVYFSDGSVLNIKNGSKGEKGEDGTMTFEELTPEQKESLKGDKGETGSPGKDGTSVTVASVSESTADGGENVVTFSDGKTVKIRNGRTGAAGVAGKDGQAGAAGKDGQDGADGKDGTSVTVTNVQESTADGGNNVVTFSDGKTLTVKNGNKGETGEKGDPGDDYVLTETDKKEIAEMNLFRAYYGQTTYAEIKDAWDAGKLCYVSNAGTFWLESMSTATNNGVSVKKAVFSKAADYATIQILTVSEDNVWSNKKVDLMYRSDKTNVVDENSTDMNVPSAKAVYDAIQEHGVESVFFAAHYRQTSYEDIIAAYTAGKLCYVDSSVGCAWLSSIGRASEDGGATYTGFAKFTITNENPFSISAYEVTESGDWSYSSFTGLTTSSRVTTVDEKSTDYNVPSAKAVYNAIQHYSKPGVYVGSGDMPDGYNVQIDPDGEPLNASDLVKTVNGVAPDENGNVEIAGMIPGGGSGTSVQPDWNQNDSAAADYIKNRPCYKIPTYLLEETQLEFSDMGGLFANVMEMSIPSETETIVVNFDGTDYKVYLAWNNDRTEASCGNVGLIGGIDSGEPFAAMLEDSMFALIVLPGTTSARVSIRTEIIKTLDTDFVPPESTVQTFDLTRIGTIQHGEFTRNNDMTEPLFDSIIRAIRVKGSVQFKVKITAKLYCQVESDGTGAKVYQDEEMTVFMTPARIIEDENGNRSCRLYSYLNGYVLEMFLAPYLVCAGLLKFTDMRYYS